MDRLKLVALDAEDIEVVSAHLQDSITHAGDIHWRPSERRMVVALNRFDWEAAIAPAHEFRRRSAALRFERVLACQCRAIDATQKDRILNLLAISFEPTDTPSGVVTLHFSGGAALRLEVECLEAELADLGPVWVTECRPAHGADDAEPAEIGKPESTAPEAAGAPLKQG